MALAAIITVMSHIATLLGGSLGSEIALQATSWPAAEQAETPEPETKLSPAGKLSLTMTPVASLGPLFVMVILLGHLGASLELGRQQRFCEREVGRRFDGGLHCNGRRFLVVTHP